MGLPPMTHVRCRNCYQLLPVRQGSILSHDARDLEGCCLRATPSCWHHGRAEVGNNFIAAPSATGYPAATALCESCALSNYWIPELGPSGCTINREYRLQKTFANLRSREGAACRPVGYLATVIESSNHHAYFDRINRPHFGYC